MKINNNIHYVVEAVPDLLNRSDLVIISAYTNKEGSTSADALNASSGTSENELVSTYNTNISSKTNSVNNNIHDSLRDFTQDNKGRTLTPDQQDFFKDSKQRDDEGNLKTMYHGTPYSFTVFNKKKAKYSGLYGKGFYFSESSNHAGQYGNNMEVYLNIVNPVSMDERTISNKKLIKFLKEVKKNEDDYSFENYGQDATPESVAGEMNGKTDFAILQDISATAIGDLVETVELYNKINKTSYDGLILPTETVVFKPEQIKDTTNEAPTDNPDIRYSSRESFEDQVDSVLDKNKKFEYSHVVVSKNTPEVLSTLLGIKDLPVLMTADHVYTSSVSKERAVNEKRFDPRKKKNYHDLGDTIKSIPGEIETPLIIIKSNTDVNDLRVVLVTSLKDKNKENVIAALKPSGEGHIGLQMVDANIMLSVYGRKLNNYINKAIEESRILYYDKTRSQDIISIPSLQLTNDLDNLDFTNNIAHYRDAVNNIIYKNSKNNS